MLLKIDREKCKDAICAFFGGRLYPPLVCLLVLLGYYTGAEMIFGYLNVLIFCFSLWFVDNAKHALPIGATFIFQISPGHAPTIPARSDYFFEGARPYFIAVLIVIVLVSLAAYVIRTRAYLDFTVKKCPMIPYMALLGIAFITNGFFSDTNTVKDLLLGAAEAFALFFFFALFYFGFRKSALKDIEGYLCYCTVWVAAVILLQMGILYATGDVLREDGAINAGKIVLGWGVSTVIGGMLTPLIPILLYGAMRRRHPVPYFVTAFLVLLACFFSMSRTALGVSALCFAVSMAIGCFFGERKTMFQMTSIIMVLVMVVAMIGYSEEVYQLFAVYFEKGLSNNGRLPLWKKCVDEFFAHPLFGAGFFGLSLGEGVSHFAHNTVFQMLGACGTVGIIAYLLYRIETVYLFFKRPSLFKSFLSVAAAATVVGSLLDVFFFVFFPLIYHSALLALAAVINLDEEQAIYSIEKL